MKTLTLFAIASLLSLHAAGPAEWIEMTAGPDFGVSYDPAVWKPSVGLKVPEPGHSQFMAWELQRLRKVKITAVTHPERKNAAEFKHEITLSQRLLGNLAEFVGERRQSFAAREWLVLEFHDTNTRSPRRQLHYLLSTEDGHVRLSVAGAGSDISEHQEAIDAFLRQVRFR